MEAMPVPSAPETKEPRTKEMVRLAAHEKALALFEASAPKEESFIVDDETGKGVYSPEMVAGHLAEVERLESIFREERNDPHSNAPDRSKSEVKEYGDILEALTLDMVQRYEWFGETTSAMKTARFDDVKNYVDVLIQLEHSRTPLALAVDVTFGFKGMQKKVARILDDIDRKKLGSVAYYRSEDGFYEGRIHSLARVVVGIEMDTLQEMAASWIDGDDATLREHYAQTLILSEISIQLREYARYARRQGHEKIAWIYEKELKKINAILEAKPDEHMENSDRVYDWIVRVVEDACKRGAAK